MKKCSGCNKIKELNDFGKDLSRKDKLSLYCLDCLKIKAKRNYQNNKQVILERKKNQHKEFPWQITWNAINQRCNNKNHIAYRYYGARGIKNLFKNWDEIKFLWFRDKAYLMKQPTIDRQDDNGNYCVDNCKFVEQGYNSTKAHNKSVLQFDLNGKLLKEWNSIKEASEYFNVRSPSIGSCLRGLTNTSCGFIWRYNNG